MKYKLIDVKSEIEENVEFGTCELCYFTGDLSKEIFVVEDEKGTKIELENGEWDWGSYCTILYIENVIDFADWLSKQDVKLEMNMETFVSLVWSYENELQMKEDSE